MIVSGLGSTRPAAIARIDPGRVTDELFNALWERSVLSVLCEQGQAAQYNHALGGYGTAQGTVAAAVDAHLGACIDVPGSGSSSGVVFTASVFPASSDVTLMAIGMREATSAFGGWIGTSTANTGIRLDGDGTFTLTKAAVAGISSGITLSLNVPYFLAASYRHSDGAVRFVVRRLDTGALTTATATNTSAYFASDGTYCFGSIRGTQFPINGKVAAGYMGARFFDTDDLVRWSLDPFGLWRETEEVTRFRAAGGAVTHATSGAITAGGSAVDGTAAHLALHITSGALVGSSSILGGTAARTRAHPATGDLVGGGALITGDVIRSEIPEHFTSGAILGDGAVVAGTAARFRAFATSGDLVGGGATVTGAAEKSGPAEHASSGDLAGGGSAVDGQAARFRAFVTSGAIDGGGATVVGIAAIVRTHATSGDLFGDGAVITGVVIRGGQVELLYVVVTAQAAFACVVTARGAYSCTVSEAIVR